jgi:hypothetical protein
VEYLELQTIFTIFCSFAVLIRLVLILLGTFCLFQFNNGLKQIFDKEWYFIPDFITDCFTKKKQDDDFPALYE